MTTAQREIPDGERLARVETRVEHLEQQMLAVHQEIRDLRQEMRDLRQEMRDLSAKVDRQFLWTLGIIITMWITVILAIAGLYAVVLRT